MSLLERVELARGRIDALQSLKQRADQAADFEQRAKVLAVLAAELEAVRVPAAVLDQAGIAVAPADEKLLAPLRARASLLKDGYALDRSAILAPFPGEDFRFVFLTPCNAFRQKAEAALHRAWSGWVQSKTPAIDHEVLRVLSTVSALSTTVTRIQAQLALIGRHEAVLPRDAGGVQYVKELCAQVNEAWHELAGDGIAEDVLGFLRTAGSSVGASFDALTPSIIKWLDEHNLRRVLRVRLG
jgi:hypothetical protein